MNDPNGFFDQLRRGEQPPGDTIFSLLHRVPPSAEESVVQVRRLLRHTEDELFELTETIGNILRWHHRDELIAALGERERGLLLVLKSLAPPAEREE